jgi:hypothetical protein
MHVPMSVKFINAKQTKETNNIKGKLHKTKAEIWYKKSAEEKECYAKIKNLRNRYIWLVLL